MNPISRYCLLCCALFLLAGCSEGRKALPEVNVTVVNAAPSYPTLNFLREQRNEASLSYRGVNLLAFDVDQYDFNVSLAAPDTGIPQIIATTAANLVIDNDYYVVLTEIGGLVEPVLLEQPAFDNSTDGAQISVFHAAEGYQDVDVYIETPGTNLAGATALGSVGFLDYLPPVTRPGGEFQLFLTAPGDPTTVLLRSLTQTLSAGQPNLLVLTLGANEGLTDLVVLRANANSTQLVDTRVQAGIRVINAAADRAARDIYRDDNFSTALITGLSFGMPSGFVTVPPGDRVFHVTPAGNPGSVELEPAFPLARGRLVTLLFSGESGALVIQPLLEDFRSRIDRAPLKVLNGASQSGNLDFFLLAPGEELGSSLPFERSVAPTITPLGELAPNAYDIVIRQAATGTVLAGPLRVTLEAGRNYGVLLLDGADAASVDIVLLDDFVAAP